MESSKICRNVPFVAKTTPLFHKLPTLRDVVLVFVSIVNI